MKGPQRSSSGGARHPCRSALLAVLSWLGLPLPAQQPAGAPADRPLGAGAIADVLQRLDRAWSAGDAARFLAAFEPDHAGAHALLAQRLQRAFASGAGTLCTSSLASAPQQVGARTVVRVRHELRTTSPTAVAAGTPLVAHSMLALRERAGTAVPTFAIEIPTDADARTDRAFRCPPCNFEVGGVAGWLCVPQRRDRAQALEGATFWLLGTDVACDVTVHIDEDESPPAVVAERLGAALRQFEAGAAAAVATAWLPPAHAAVPPARLAGARLAVDLPAPRGTSRALFHVIAFGALRHLLLVRGGSDALREHHGAVDALLHSFRLLDTACDEALAAARPVEHHTGGTLAAGLYHNTTFALELTGPPGWKAQQRCGGAEFRVLWTSPGGSRLWLTGYGVPAGLPRWCTATADRWLADLCAAQGMEPAAGTGGWTRAGTGDAQVAAITWTARPGGDPAVPAERTLRVWLRDDLLIVADGVVKDPADAEPLRAAVAGLRLR